MKPIAIHRRDGSYSDRWIACCRERGIPHKIVCAYDSDIIDQLKGTSALLWHFGHGLPTDLLMARHVLEAAAASGLVVYPDRKTCWHFDDKVAQKYLLEAVGAPLVPTHVFYDLDQALAWIDRATFPKVFKLRRGSGSRNVRLARTADDARRLARQAFGRGFRPSGTITGNAWKLAKAWRKGDLGTFVMDLPKRLINRRRLDAGVGRERGYLYFQDFAADNAFDTRVTIIGHRAFMFTRDVRPGDFRASGSGRINYDRARVRTACVETAFRVAGAIGAQTIAFDFVDDGTSTPRIVEVSYGFDSKPIFDCDGYMDEGLSWHEAHVWPEHAILDDVLDAVERKAPAGA